MHYTDSVAYYAYLLRKLSLEMSVRAGSGHPTSCFSCAEIMAVLFFQILVIDTNDFENHNNDRFILSKGHASAILYAAWHLLKKLSYENLLTYRQFDSVLEGHPTSRFLYTEAATGSLGNGLGIGVGQALYAKREALTSNIYVLVGDGELFEGSNWEAAALASYYALDNLIVIIDCNRLGQSCPTMFQHHVDRYEEKFKAFGFHTQIVDGHSVDGLVNAFQQANKKDTQKPQVVIAKTFKGHGIALVENQEGFHGKPLIEKKYTDMLSDFDVEKADKNSIKIEFPKGRPLIHVSKKVGCCMHQLDKPSYKENSMISTRYAFGEGLVSLGQRVVDVMVLDGDVQNSTFTELFAKAFPKKFVQCFIGEQAMVNVAIGLARRGSVAFLATFGSFLSRAHDQIRMAAIGRVPLRICGSHAGISIGQDGPSQMALEDIAFMRCLPDSVVLYPSDAISSFKLVQQMYTYTKGISYLRTTRSDVPVLYDADQSFEIGKAIVLKQHTGDVACVVAAGITVFEALKAYEQLQKIYNKTITIIDLYSIKPFDRKMVIDATRNAHGNMIVVEDHYYEGGIGEMVRSACAGSNFEIISLAVKQLPRSGSQAQLLSWAQIDAEAIVNAVLDLKQ
ncbi:MAG TPA: transketolase [Patescibacteria group bacterium]|jgi:transketolase|nr:transketolase [Patescibacteria group bacterium]